MADRKKISTDELYASKQWSDNMSFSREAMNESKKKKTKSLEPAEPEKESRALSTGGLKDAKREIGKTARKTGQQLDKYVDEMNQEMGRISDSVGQTFDSVGDKISGTMHDTFAPMGEALTRLGEALIDGLRAMTIGVAKAIVVEFTTVLRTISEKLGGSPAAQPRQPSQRTPRQPVPRNPTTNLTGPLPPGTEPLPAPVTPTVPTYPVGFGTLLENKIFFATIHNRPFLTEQDVREYQPGNAQQEYDWMTRAVEEIRNCAPYGQKLPTPTKGAFLGIPMFDILREIEHDDLAKFLKFVNNRPQPFKQKALKLSEAYATWVHKGAPEK